MQISITQADAVDAPHILLLQRLAYQSEADFYRDHTIEPLTQTLDGLSEELSHKYFLKAEHDGALIGTARGHLDKSGTAHVERLAVHPLWQGRGVGARLLCALEAAFPLACRFELFTGQRSERNIQLYTRHGYAIFRVQQINDRLAFVFMEKTR